MSDSSPTLIQALACDDVRIEGNGKQILIGVYADKLLVPDFPAQISICLWMRMQFPSAGHHKIELSAITGRGGVKLLPQAELPINVMEPNGCADLSVGGIELQLHMPGFLEFQWREVGQQDWATVLRIGIDRNASI